jgi:acyl transferase domain-containing protein
MLAKDGRCKVFDASADGYVRGEGGAAIVIMRLNDAEGRRRSSGSDIHGIIRSVVLNHNGIAAAYTAPNGASQSELLMSAMHQAHVQANDIVYIESHGTGTKLGDPVEWTAIEEVFLKQRDLSLSPLVIGAVKSNIGHLEASAGIAGLIKTLLVLKNLKAPPNLHMNVLNPLITNGLNRAVFPQEITTVGAMSKTICAGLSSFGSGKLYVNF